MNNDLLPRPKTNHPRVLVVDVETTGLDARTCSILEIGAQWLVGGPEGEAGEFSGRCKAWPGARIEEKALEINGRTLRDVHCPDLPTEGQLVEDFLTWVALSSGPQAGPVVIAGLTPSFERAHIREACNRMSMKRPFPFRHRTLDLHSLALARALSMGAPVPEGGMHTDEIYELLGLPGEPKPHRAMAGARCEAEAFRLLMGLGTFFDELPMGPEDDDGGLQARHVWATWDDEKRASLRAAVQGLARPQHEDEMCMADGWHLRAVRVFENDFQESFAWEMIDCSGASLGIILKAP